MAGYPLQPLLNVRRFRETGAMNDLRRAELAVTEAEAEVTRCKEELERYRQWLIEEEDRRYDAFMNTETDRTGIENFRHEIAVLRMSDTSRAQAVLAAEQALVQRRAEVVTAKEAVAAARRDISKVEAHQEVWSAAEYREAMRLEDLETEEFKSTGPSLFADE